MIEYLRMLKDGVRHMSYGDPYEGPTVQASDVVQWAVDEIARLRLTDAEREAVGEMAEICDSRERLSITHRLGDEADHWRCRAATVRGILTRTGGEKC